MKKIIFILFSSVFLFASVVCAEKGYINVSGNILCGPNNTTCCTHTLPDVSSGEHSWVATAYDTENMESGPSNEVSLNNDTGASVRVTFEWDPNSEPDLIGYRIYEVVEVSSGLVLPAPLNVRVISGS